MNRVYSETKLIGKLLQIPKFYRIALMSQFLETRTPYFHDLFISSALQTLIYLQVTIEFLDLYVNVTSEQHSHDR